MPNTDKSKIKKVVATVKEEYTEPDFVATWKCPYCKASDYQNVWEENYTETITCGKCQQKIKVKIPKYF